MVNMMMVELACATEAESLCTSATQPSYSSNPIAHGTVDRHAADLLRYIQVDMPSLACDAQDFAAVPQQARLQTLKHALMFYTCNLNFPQAVLRSELLNQGAV